MLAHASDSMEAERTSVPWRVDNLVVLYATTFVSAVMILIAWWGASGTTRLGAQLAWVNVGVAGVIVAGTGNAVWILYGRRAISVRRRQLVAEIPYETSHVRPVPQATAGRTPPGTLVAAPRMTRFHRPDCPLVVGKTVATASRSSHEEAGRRPCGVCRP